MHLRVLSLLFLLFISYPCVFAGMDSCHDEHGTPSLCMPKFENAAFNRTVTVSNTCGSPPEDYCMQTGSTRLCHHCNAWDPETSRNATYLTDFHTDEEPTWWQSQSMFYGVQYPNSINLTLHLGKAFEITYVHLKFYTSRPESFAIYKRTSEAAPWQPYQFYSASCQKTYGRDAKGYIRPGEEERTALCTDEFSDISPLTGGNVAFSTLEGRPSAYNFDQSPVLQEWVTATDLLISLNRLNTFGDEFFKDPKVLRSYFYAISDFSVGGRCKCNGHASQCVPSEAGRLACVCEHHTAGSDCQHCAPFYQEQPWARAAADSANPCMMCNCSGHADECVFDVELYRSTGSGGRCIGCRGNTSGAHCESCRENFYRASPLQPCHNCTCNTMGSESLQCDNDGVCLCRPTVMGVKCDVCKPGFHSLVPGGCRLCECDERGRVGVCSAEDGSCSCKANVEGHACNRCKPESFNLQLVNPDGCQTCFCFGHSVACSSSNQHVAFNITSDFLQDPDGWVGKFSEHQESPLMWKEGEVYLLPYSEEDTGYYKAPEKFLGNQLLSYGQHLFLVFTAESWELLPSSVTVILEGSGISVSANLHAEEKPGSQLGHLFHNSFRLRLSEREVTPSLPPFEFQRLLSNLTVLLISNAGGQNYTSQLSGVTLISATLVKDHSSTPHQPPAPWVEACTCPLGFTGQFCERCASGFSRETPSSGPYSPCVPCNCNQHGTCHPETGVCECTDFTTGVSCERCQDGYYGNALIGNPSDCLPCPCPDRTTCAEVPEAGGVVCTNCPASQRGTRCQLCEDGLYGDPLGWGGKERPCVRCECNGNVDPNAVGGCDHVTGRCLKCLGHTAGDHCDKCQTGYYGNALDRTLRPSQKCKSCDCKSPGSSGSVNDCDPDTGRCSCLSHVTGRDCGQCEAGYFNLQPVLGCQWCNCSPIGSLSSACQPITGQCLCRTGVEGRWCDACRMGFFGFSSRGCRACNCDPMGSTSMQCHGNGTCICRQGFVGYKCDKCELNFYLNHVSHQCEECPVCYSLIRDQASKLKRKLQDLERLLSSYDCRSFRHELYIRPSHMPQPKEMQNRVHEHQSEDYLPNALEEFLAIQEAREAFMHQFSQLQVAVQELQIQLGHLGEAVNCSLAEEGETGRDETEDGVRRQGGNCRALSDAFTAAMDAHTQLRRMTLDLDSMVIPFVMPRGPTQWNTLVNQSETLVKSHTEIAAHIEKLAGEALQVSNRTYSVLLNLLDDNSTQLHVQDLTERLSEMQVLKENLTREADKTLAVYLSVQEQTTKAAAILQNVTSNLPKLHKERTGVSSFTAEFNTTMTMELIQSLDLANRTAELDFLVQSKEQLVNKTKEEMEAQLENSRKNLQTIEEFQQLTAIAKELKEIALSSVVQGKKTESEAFSLQKHLEDIQKEWPALHTHTRQALKRESLLDEKVLTEAKKKVQQAKRALRPALDNATLAGETAADAKLAADAVTKDARAALSRGKQARKESAQLREAVTEAGRQLARQEERASQAWVGMPVEEADVSLETEMDSMEMVKSQLETFTNTLAKLLNQLEGNVAVEKYERVLNETTARLLLLRGSVESPTLSAKIQRLRTAGHEQLQQLAQLEQNLQEIREERDSLTDIVQNLPKACPESGH
ncbi:laminin subunit gamma-3 [Electrophorus electricus]|uniref:laminin subunit gamma-3 n=1 Tax=Electrophorus electricus TaxID=8005 RepID=UPI0015D0C137|nr:laminin subunit gamma-3 [Electrophorus electricus]